MGGSVGRVCLPRMAFTIRGTRRGRPDDLGGQVGQSTTHLRNVVVVAVFHALGAPPWDSASRGALTHPDGGTEGDPLTDSFKPC